MLTYIDLTVLWKDSNEVNKLEIVWETASEAASPLIGKCVFLESSVKFLGHIIENGRIFPSKRKIKIIHEFSDRSTARQTQSFLDLTSKGTSTNVQNYLYIFWKEFKELVIVYKSKTKLCDYFCLYRIGAEVELHTDVHGFEALLM